jgi:antitoxin (DNA-binding transcriptional repressor) of toxin-antitoxin stability system
LNIHLHCLVLDGVYLNRDGAAVFHEAAPPSTHELAALPLSSKPLGFTGFVCHKFLRDNSLMTQVSVEEMQRDLSACLRRVEAGETLLIMRAGKPVAEVKPIGASVETLRPFGLCKGEFTVPDDFDAPLPEDVLKAFEGK